MINKDILLDGDIILFHARGFNIMSMAIRKLTQSFWNHVGVYYEDIYLNGYVIEALGGGIVRTPVDKYLDEKKNILKIVRFSKEAFNDDKEYKSGIGLFVERMKQKVGSKYDWGAIIWLGFKYIFKGSYKSARQYVPIGNPLQSRDKFFCSEIVCESAYKISSINDYMFQGNTKQTCDTTTPKDVGKSKLVKCVGGKDVN